MELEDESEIGDWWIEIFECKTLENGDGQSMPGVTKTTHCIFLRERQSGSVTSHTTQ